MKLYHLSDKYLGKRPTLVPRVPVNRDSTEPDTPRICVAPTLVGCYKSLIALMDLANRFPAMHVYCAESDKSVPAKKVYDARVTQERWLLEATQFQHLGKMPRIWLQDLRNDQPKNVQSRIIGEYVSWAEFTADLRPLEEVKI